MARNKPLLSLLQDYRAEIRASTNAAHNTSARETQVRLLRRVQETLWEDYDWPHMRVTRYVDLQAGQRYYQPPEDLSLDRLEKIEVRYGQLWVPLCHGIDASHYSTWDSELDERSWPVERWEVHEDREFELWPIPADNADPVSLEGRLKLEGIRNLRPLVADDDLADLDDRLIVLFAAAETLAASGAQDAPLKLKAAQDRKASLTQNFSKMHRFSLYGSSGAKGRMLKGPPRVHYRDRETS